LITQRKEHGDNDLRISGGVGKQFYDNLHGWGFRYNFATITFLLSL